MPVDADLRMSESTALSYWRHCAVRVPEPLILLKNRSKSGTYMYGGERGIRTLEGFNTLHAFQACAIDHSATSPEYGGNPPSHI